jgi:hypothetical protein
MNTTPPVERGLSATRLSASCSTRASRSARTYSG